MEALVVLAKVPEKGAVKTRLAEHLGDDAALRLYRAFCLDTMALIATWKSTSVGVDTNRRVVIHVTPTVDDDFVDEMVRVVDAPVLLQSGRDLGERLQNAFDEAYSRGARAVCAIGSDSPTLFSHMIDHAFRALLWEDVVVGPTFDGGYWLVGSTRPNPPSLFESIPWSTENVVRTTTENLREAGIVPHTLPFWYDVDTVDDVKRLAWHLEILNARGVNHAPATHACFRELGLFSTVRR